MTGVTQYPFDTEQLQKGDTIPPETIEHAYGVKRNDIRYQFALLRAKEFVRRRFLDRGQIVTIAARDSALHILTDEVQAAYNPAEYKAGIRKMRGAHGRMLGADRSQITDPEILATHDRAIEVQGRQLAAIARERHIPPPMPTPRLTPGSTK